MVLGESDVILVFQGQRASNRTTCSKEKLRTLASITRKHRDFRAATRGPFLLNGPDKPGKANLDTGYIKIIARKHDGKKSKPKVVR